jgi:PhnB protein
MSEAKPAAGAVRAVIPMLVCHDGAAEVDFCKTAFGAAELSRRSAPDGSVVHATLAIGGAMIMIHDESPHLASRAPQSDGSSSVVIYLYVGDADATIARAVAAGARVLLPAANQFWGDRVGRIVDPAGHVWNVASRSLESSPNIEPTKAKSK